jgi:hypothetical protein
VIARAELERDLVIVACAISAGIHAALMPEHLSESIVAGAGFGFSVILLGALVVALTRRPSVPALAAAAVVLGGLLVSYAFAVTTGVPGLHPDPDTIGGLALFTKAIEIVGLLATAHLLLRARAGVPFISPRPRGIPA